MSKSEMYRSWTSEESDLSNTVNKDVIKEMPGVPVRGRGGGDLIVMVPKLTFCRPEP